MFTISNISKKLFEKLRRKQYRDAYVGEHVRRGIATQIRALRDQRGWKQGEFSNYLGKPQSVVSRLEDPSYGKVTVQTLLEVAATFDVALQVRFITHSSFVQQTRDLTTASMQVVGFVDDIGFKSSIRNRGDMKVIETEKAISTAQLSTDTSHQDIAAIFGIELDSVGDTAHVH